MRRRMAGLPVGMYRIAAHDLINAHLATPTPQAPDPFAGRPRLRFAMAAIERLERKP